MTRRLCDCRISYLPPISPLRILHASIPPHPPSFNLSHSQLPIQLPIPRKHPPILPYSSSQVLLEIKQDNTNSFLFTTTCPTPNAELIEQVTQCWNMRLRIEQLCGACDELAKHGPMKPPDAQGIDTVEDMGTETALVECKQGERSGNYAADPLGHRTGNAPAAKVGEVLAKTCADARAYVDKAHVQRREPQDLAVLQEKVRAANVRAWGGEGQWSGGWERS